MQHAVGYDYYSYAAFFPPLGTADDILKTVRTVVAYGPSK